MIPIADGEYEYDDPAIGIIQDAKTTIGLSHDELDARSKEQMDDHLRDVRDGLCHGLNQVKEWLNEHYYHKSAEEELLNCEDNTHSNREKLMVQIGDDIICTECDQKVADIKEHVRRKHPERFADALLTAAEDGDTG